MTINDSRFALNPQKNSKSLELPPPHHRIYEKECKALENISKQRHSKKNIKFIKINFPNVINLRRSTSAASSSKCFSQSQGQLKPTDRYFNQI